MSKVWAFSQSTGSERLILLAIADFADDNGSAYPAVETLAKKARVSERTVQYSLRALVKLGELAILQGEGPRGCNLYRVQNLQGAPCDNQGVQDTTKGGAVGCTRTISKPSIEPSNSEVALPFTSQPFADAWQTWLTYRRERKLPTYKPTSLRKQFEQLKEWGERAAIHAINESIRNQWQGLFAPKGTNAPVVGTPVRCYIAPAEKVRIPDNLRDDYTP